MIDVTETDINMPEVLTESKLVNLNTRYKYHAYGLRNECNQPVCIEYNSDRVCRADVDFEIKIVALMEFFRSNGIEIETDSESENVNRIDIGLRKDLRTFCNRNGKPMLASSVLSTIVYCLEGRIDLNQLRKFKIAAIPKLTVVIPATRNMPRNV